MIDRDRMVAALQSIGVSMRWHLPLKEHGICMAQKRQGIKSRMRVEYKKEQRAYIIHDLSDNEVYFLDEDQLPEWARESMSLLHLLPVESELDGVGFYYAPGIYYLEIKTAVPSGCRRKLDAG